MKLVKTAMDRKSEKVDVYWQDTLALCPALSLFLKTYAETIDNGHSNPSVAWSNKNRVVWAQKGSEVVAGIVYEYVPEHRMGWVVLSFTDAKWRGRGINGILHQVVAEDIKKLGGERVSSLIHVENAAMLKASESAGFKPQFYRTNKMLK